MFQPSVKRPGPRPVDPRPSRQLTKTPAKVWAFLDENWDGFADEIGVEGNEGMMETDARGFFSFMLAPGSYALQVEPPKGFPRPHLLSRFSIEQTQPDPVELEVVLSEVVLVAQTPPVELVLVRMTSLLKLQR